MPKSGPRVGFEPGRWRVLVILETLGNVGDFVGGIGVVVTLLYLVTQLRQNTRQIEHNSELVKGSAELETARLMGDWHGLMVSSPDLVRIWSVHMAEGASALTPEERNRMVWVIAQYFTLAEGLYRQHLRGFLDADSWEAYERTLSGLLRRPLAAEFVTSGTSAFSGEFRKLCLRLIESPRDDDWQYTDLDSFGMSESSD